jgi:hypothetical protein
MTPTPPLSILLVYLYELLSYNIFKLRKNLEKWKLKIGSRKANCKILEIMYSYIIWRGNE